MENQLVSRVSHLPKTERIKRAAEQQSVAKLKAAKEKRFEKITVLRAKHAAKQAQASKEEETYDLVDKLQYRHHISNPDLDCKNKCSPYDHDFSSTYYCEEEFRFTKYASKQAQAPNVEDSYTKAYEEEGDSPPSEHLKRDYDDLTQISKDEDSSSSRVMDGPKKLKKIHCKQM